MTKLDPGDVDGIPIVCEVCGTITTSEELDDAKGMAESHNESRHGGDDVAVVVDEPYDVDTSRPKGNRGKEFVKSIMDAINT